MSTEQFKQRRSDLLAGARAVAEKAKLDNRGLTTGEQDQVDAALAEARDIGERLAASEKSAQILAGLDAMAAGNRGMNHNGGQAAPLLGLPGDGQRLAFSKQMATAAATKIAPPASKRQAVRELICQEL
jgi:hypothetical protein